MNHFFKILLFSFFSVVPLELSNAQVSLNTANSVNSGTSSEKTLSSSDESKIYALFKRFSEGPIELLCSSLDSEKVSSCKKNAEDMVIRKFYEYIKSGTLKSIKRSDLTSFLEDKNFINQTLMTTFMLNLKDGNKDEKRKKIKARVREQILKCRISGDSYLNLSAQFGCIQNYLSANELEKLKLKLEIWEKYKIILIERESLKSFSIEEIKKFKKAYFLIDNSIYHKFGATKFNDFTHLWGQFGFLEKAGNLVINGQFGEVRVYEFPLKVNVVVDVTKLNKNHVDESSSILNKMNKLVKSGPFDSYSIARRILHENAHVQDHITGKRNWDWFWSSPENGQQPYIYKLCDIDSENLQVTEINYRKCYVDHTEYFNFFPTSYVTRPNEFYTKMLESWFDDLMGKKSSRAYRCQSPKTDRLWREMEKNLVGQETDITCPK